MKIWIGTRYIDTDYFRTWCLNEDLHMVYFIHQPKDTHNGEFSLPLLFSSLEEAKRFYEETWMAITDNIEEYWCLDKQTSFCWTLYFKLHTQQLKLRKNVLLVSITRGEEIMIPNGDSRFFAGDSVVVVVSGDENVLQLNDIFE